MLSEERLKDITEFYNTDQWGYAEHVDAIEDLLAEIDRLDADNEAWLKTCHVDGNCIHCVAKIRGES